MLDQSHIWTSPVALSGAIQNNSVTAQSRRSNTSEIVQAIPEIMAPGHLYNAKTRTGIEWLPPKPGNDGPGSRGKVRLWSRNWLGQSVLLAEAEHNSLSLWDYWYNLEFAKSFPFVTHWWFGDAWTGIVQLWGPSAVGCDPESGAPTLSGWLRFHNVLEIEESSAEDDDHDHTHNHDHDHTHDHDHDHESSVPHEYETPALPWTLLITNPARISLPMPPGFIHAANLPLQMLLGERLMHILALLSASTTAEDNMTNPTGSLDESTPLRDARPMYPVGKPVTFAVTSLVCTENLVSAFPTNFGPWRLDRAADMTPREAFCRLLGLDVAPAPGTP